MEAANKAARARRIGISNFTRLLLVPCVARFSSDPAFAQFRLRSIPRCACRFEPSEPPSDSYCAEFHTACETARRCAAKDARPRFHWLECNSAAIILLWG